MIKQLLKIWNKSFRFQLIFGIGFVLTILISLYNYIHVKEHSDFLYSQATDEAINRSYELANISKVWVMANDYAGLEEVLSNFSIYDDIVFGTVVNMDGKIVAHSDINLVGKYIADENRISYLKNSYKQTGYHDHDEVILLQNKYFIDIIRMIHQSDNHIGLVNIRLDTSKIKENVDTTIIEVIFFTVLTFLIAIAFAYLIVNGLTKQLSRLIATMKAVRDGDKNARAEEYGVRELSKLAHEFNHTLDALAESENKSKELKEQLEYAVNGSGDGLWDWNIETDEIYFSKRFKEILGYKESEYTDKIYEWEKDIHPDDIKKVFEDIELSHKNPGINYENIHRIRHKDGHWVWVLDRGQTIFNGEGRPVRMVGFYTDITKQKLLENELKEHEELMIAQSRHAAMGEMIGMIAHQWRQPLSTISMGANNMLLDIELGEIKADVIKDEIVSINEQVKHLSQTIEDFRNYFRPDIAKESANVEAVIREALSILGKSLENNDIEIVLNLSSVSNIDIFKRELIQVLINIINNAKEAMNEYSVGDKKLLIATRETSEEIIIEICDNGGGIDKKIIHKIFEPYFSTKNKQVGTGIGLYMSKIIIEKHLNGKIEAVENKIGGTCFVLSIHK